MSPARQLQPPVASRGPIRPAPEETAALARVASAVEAGAASVRVGDEDVPLPRSILEALRVSALELARGNAVFVIPVQAELTTQQAADMLNVSRPHLVSLIESGDLPAKRVGSHRRVLLHDVLDYKQRQDEARRKGLDKLSRVSEELGIPF